MDNYELDKDEAVINQVSGRNTGVFGGSVDLILTNKNIIQVNRGILGGDSTKYPLTDLKLLNGKPNVRVGKSRSGERQIEIYFKNDELFLILDGLFAENSWVGAISKAYKQRVAETENDDEKGSLFDSIKGIIARDDNKKKPKRKTCKCPKCGAELVGEKGSEVECEYCGAIVRIK